jgi:hypothetical protein
MNIFYLPRYTTTTNLNPANKEMINDLNPANKDMINDLNPTDFPKLEISPSLYYYLKQKSLTEIEDNFVSPPSKYHLKGGKLYFELMEVFLTLNLECNHTQSYEIGHFLPAYSDVIFFFQVSKNKHSFEWYENNSNNISNSNGNNISNGNFMNIMNDIHWVGELPNNQLCLGEATHQFDYLFYEITCPVSPIVLVPYQCVGGTGIFKMNIEMPVERILFLYWLVQSYQQVIWFLPTISAPTTRFWICKHYLGKTIPFPNKVPLYFLNKVEEMNNILGQEIIETRRKSRPRNAVNL